MRKYEIEIRKAISDNLIAKMKADDLFFDVCRTLAERMIELSGLPMKYKIVDHKDFAFTMEATVDNWFPIVYTKSFRADQEQDYNIMWEKYFHKHGYAHPDAEFYEALVQMANAFKGVFGP